MKQCNQILCATVILLVGFFSGDSASAKENSAKVPTFNASLAFLPVSAEDEQTGSLVQMLRLWEQATKIRINIGVYPFKRSLKMAIDGKSDFHIPLIKSPFKTADELGFDYSTSSLFPINFVLYSHKKLSLDKNNLAGYHIYTDAAHSNLFDFKILSSFDVRGALRKLDKGRIDGFIYADLETDPLIKAMGLKNIKRQFYRTYQVHAVLAKGKKGGAADKMITKAMKHIKDSGQWDKLRHPDYLIYDDWQP